MPLVVEDGTGKADANSYVDISFLDDYHQTRGNTAWGELTQSEKEQSAVRASEYVDKRFGRRFVGYRESRLQALEWPRLNAFDMDGYLLSGEEEVPILLKKGVAEYALRAAIYHVLAPDPLRSAPAQDMTTLDQSGRTAQQSGAVKRKSTKAGPVETETEYQTAADQAEKQTAARGLQSGLVSDFSIPEYPEADLWISELLRASHQGATLVRGD